MIEVTVDALTTNELSTLSYNVSAYIVSSSASIQSLGMRKYTTLNDDFTPYNITEISILEWIPVFNTEEDEMPSYLNAVVEWKPAIDRTCNYDVVYFGIFGHENEEKIDEKDVGIENLYEFTIEEKLKFGEEYSIGVRGKNMKHIEKESHMKWFKFTAPTSINNQSPIEKIKIKNLTIESIQHLGDKKFNINVTWITNIEPDDFEISIHDADENNLNITIEPIIIDGHETSYTFKNVKILGSSFRVELIAFKDNHSDTAIEVKFVPVYEKDKLSDILFYSLVAFMFLLLIALFKVWKGRIDSFISILAQKRLEHMDLETVKTISTGTVLDSIAELTKDVSMEIETENITMLESLGEGAFGLVNKALVIRNGEKQYVAVKMLKSKILF